MGGSFLGGARVVFSHNNSGDFPGRGFMSLAAKKRIPGTPFKGKNQCGTKTQGGHVSKWSLLAS